MDFLTFLNYSRMEVPPIGARLNYEEPIANGLMYGWTMHEGPSISYDIRGKGNNIAWTAANLSLGSGPFSRTAPTFNGTNVGGTVAMDLSSTSILSCSFWYYQPQTANDDKLVFEFGTNWNIPGSFFFNPLEPSNATGGYYFKVYGDTGSNGNMIPRGGVGWHHVSITWDLTLSGSEMPQGFLDGAPQTVTAYTGIQANNGGALGNLTLYLGARSGDVAPATSGTMLANLLFHNRYLTVAEVQRLYQAPHHFLERPKRFFVGGSSTTTATPSAAAATATSPAVTAQVRAPLGAAAAASGTAPAVNGQVQAPLGATAATGTAPAVTTSPSGNSTTATPGAAAATATIPAVNCQVLDPQPATAATGTAPAVTGIVHVALSAAAATGMAPAVNGQVQAPLGATAATATAPAVTTTPSGNQDTATPAAGAGTGTAPAVTAQVRAPLGAAAAATGTAPASTVRIFALPGAAAASAVGADLTGRIVSVPLAASATGTSPSSSPAPRATPVAAIGQGSTANDPNYRIVIQLAAASSQATANDPATIPSAILFVTGVEDMWRYEAHGKSWNAFQADHAWTAKD